jgi:uncharacterized protein
VAGDAAGQGFFPRQVGIDAYGNGGFRFADMSHRGSLLCLPSGMSGWAVSSSAEATPESFAAVFAAADEIDVLLFGQGTDIAPFDKSLRQALRERGIIVEALSTGSAVRTYNVLLAEERRVAAALIAVETAR